MVSVIIPMYNAEKTITACINSVLDQTFQNFIEIIVINDGSLDASEEVVNSLSKISRSNRSIRLISQKNRGVSAARNVGLKSASQDWVALIDSDDVWTLNKLELQFNQIEANKNILIIGSDFNNKHYIPPILHRGNTYKLSPAKIIFKWWPSTPTLVFHSCLFKKFQIFYDENMKHGEDGRFLLTVSQITDIHVLPISTVLAGHGKRTFGESGLSANLKKMHEGELNNLSFARTENMINRALFVLLRCWLSLKYLRRVIIVKVF